MKPYKLGTAEISGASVPVVLFNGRAHLLRDIIGTDCPPSVFALLQDWDRWAQRLGAVGTVPHTGLDPDALTYRPPVEQPRKIICIGINYRDHLAEMNSGAPPDLPYAFMRPPTSLAGHGETIQLPKKSKMVDWEAELGVVIGRRFHGDDPIAARAAVAGYTVINDVSARDWIASRQPAVGVDWVIHKAWDQFQPTGPWITPAEFVPEPQALSIELTLNGVVKQRSNTSQMLFSVQQIVCHLGTIMTLEPGDIIATGTPAGVGFGRKPPEFIRSGDVVRITIADLGTLENTFT